MRARSVPTLHTIDAVARSLELATPMAEDAGRAVPAPVPAPYAETGKALDYLTARRRVAEAGVRYPAAAPVRGVAGLRAAAAELAGPYVLKAGWVEHKTEVGGVAVALADGDAAEAAFLEMSARLGEGEYVLEQMDTQRDTVELIVGARRDPSFGPVVLVGVGGVQAELYRDVQLALAPVSEDEARSMIASLRAHALFEGWRGRPPVDVASAAAVVVAVSRLLVDGPDLVECEVNPLRVGPDGAVAVDALVVADRPTTDRPTPFREGELR